MMAVRQCRCIQIKYDSIYMASDLEGGHTEHYIITEMYSDMCKCRTCSSEPCNDTMQLACGLSLSRQCVRVDGMIELVMSSKGPGAPMHN
jgi:hypothetical protein